MNRNPIRPANNQSDTKPADALRAKRAKEILGGDFLLKKSTRKMLPFLILLTGLAISYIANSYYIERKLRHISELRKELKELRYEFVSSKSKLMHEGKQSQLAEKLKSTGLKEATEPIKKIHDQH